MHQFDNPNSIKHFQSLCDACQALVSSNHSPLELTLYSKGYIDSLRKSEVIDRKEIEKLENLISRWILDPSSFIGPNGDISTLFYKKEST